MPYDVTWKQFAKDLKNEIKDDVVVDKAAGLAFYLMLAIFPAMIALLSLIPFLPIPNLEQAVMDLMRQALPGEAATLFTKTVRGIVSEQKGGLLSVGILLAIWTASSGTYAVMQQVNRSYDVTDDRPFWKARGLAILLALFFGLVTVSAFGLVILGGVLQDWMASTLGWVEPILTLFSILRWVIILSGLLLGFAVMYYYGVNADQKFKFITPGSAVGVGLLVLATLGFKIYVENFGNYNATYGALGAVIVLMLWLFILGLVILVGAEVNALIEHYSPEGKRKGEKHESGRPGGPLTSSRDQTTPGRPVPGHA